MDAGSPSNDSLGEASVCHFLSRLVGRRFVFDEEERGVDAGKLELEKRSQEDCGRRGGFSWSGVFQGGVRLGPG